jgi:hypothetical protein
MKMGQCFETSAFKLQTPGNYPEESIQHLEHGESLETRTADLLHQMNHKRSPCTVESLPGGKKYLKSMECCVWNIKRACRCIRHHLVHTWIKADEVNRDLDMCITLRHKLQFSLLNINVYVSYSCGNRHRLFRLFRSFPLFRLFRLFISFRLYRLFLSFQ